MTPMKQYKAERFEVLGYYYQCRNCGAPLMSELARLNGFCDKRCKKCYQQEFFGHRLTYCQNVAAGRRLTDRN